MVPAGFMQDGFMRATPMLCPDFQVAARFIDGMRGEKLMTESRNRNASWGEDLQSRLIYMSRLAMDSGQHAAAPETASGAAQGFAAAC
jgi:hypothetical protein